MELSPVVFYISDPASKEVHINICRSELQKMFIYTYKPIQPENIRPKN